MADPSDDGPEPATPCEAERELIRQAGETKWAEGDAAMATLRGIRAQMESYETTWAQYGDGNPLYLEIRGHHRNLTAQIASDGLAWNDVKTAFNDAMANLSCRETNWSFLLGVLWERYTALQAKAAALQWAVTYWSATLNDWKARAYPS